MPYPLQYGSRILWVRDCCDFSVGLPEKTEVSIFFPVSKAPGHPILALVSLFSRRTQMIGIGATSPAAHYPRASTLT